MMLGWGLRRQALHPQRYPLQTKSEKSEQAALKFFKRLEQIDLFKRASGHLLLSSVRWFGGVLSDFGVVMCRCVRDLIFVRP